MTNQKKSRTRKLTRRQKVILKVLPPGLTDGLPEEDQQAISAVVGKPVVFEGYERNGAAKLEFMDKDDVIHLIWVEPKFVKPWRASSIRKHCQDRREGDSPHATKRGAFREGRERRRQKKLDRGQRVVLEPLPPEVIAGFPLEGQQVIAAVVGKPVVFFNKYQRDGDAELEFIDRDNTTHLIYMDPKFIRPW